MLDMILLKKFTEEEVLKIIASFACETLPDKSKGIIEAAYMDDNSVNVYFIESSENKLNKPS